MRLMSLATWFKNTTFEPPYQVTTKLDPTGRVFYALLENDQQTIRFRFFDSTSGLVVYESVDEGEFKHLVTKDRVETVIECLEVHLNALVAT